MRGIHKIIYTLMLAGITFLGCHKREGVTPQPDPCSTALSNPLTFKLLNSVENILFESDSIFCGSVVFEAPQEYSSFAWRIGNDSNTVTARRFSIKFDQPVGTIQVQLIAKRQPNLTCFPHDDGIDTLSKSLTILPIATTSIPHTAIEGTYVGALIDSPKDTFKIRVKRFPLLTDPNQERLVLTNINRGCKTNPADVTWGYKGFSFVQQRPNYSFDNCDYVVGGGFLDPTDSNKIRLEYTQRSSGTGSDIPKVFLGQRVR